MVTFAFAKSETFVMGKGVDFSSKTGLILVSKEGMLTEDGSQSPGMLSNTIMTS